MPPSLKIFPDSQTVATNFAADLVELIQSLLQKQTTVSVCLSGGSTPKKLYQILASEYGKSVDWPSVHFYWGDERCVPPEDPASNFGEASRRLFSRIDIPPENIHRVIGEANPEDECTRYGQEILSNLNRNEDGLPEFDIVVLGMGDDGHTASIFPNQIDLIQSDRLCELATHPESGQRRITLTGPVLNSADNIFFLVTGQAKSEVLAKIILRSDGYEVFPTAHIAPDRSRFYIDQAAGSEM